MSAASGHEQPVSIAASDETGRLGIMHLKRLWSAVTLQRQGVTIERDREWRLDQIVMDALGVGEHQALAHLFETCPAFHEFEAWIVDTAGQPSPHTVARFNALVTVSPPPPDIRRWLKDIESDQPVLSAADLDHWDMEGYVILKNAAPAEDVAAAADAIWQHTTAGLEHPESWYHTRHTGIMVELVQHAALQKIRRSRRVHKAFAQLWATADLWMSADRCGFHPPQRATHPFPGPDLHWDVDFSRPLTFGTQGILYLTDTPAEQGALTLVPGFHRRLREWLGGLPAEANPLNTQPAELHALGSIPVAGATGDLVIWHHHLPHGSRPNLGQRPRLVQYLNMRPGAEIQSPAALA